MADSGKRRLNHCPKCKMYFVNTHCPICKEYRPQSEYDEQFRDLQGIPEKYRSGLRNSHDEISLNNQCTNKYGENTQKKKVKYSIKDIILDLLKAFGVLILFAALGAGLVFLNLYDDVDIPSASTDRPTEVFPQNGNFEVISPCIRATYFSFTNQRNDYLYIRFKSEDGETTFFEIYMWPNSTAEFTVPSGKYMVCYAIGNLTDDFMWYGKNDRFVGGTSYYVDTMTILPNGLQFTLAKGSSVSGGVSQSSKSIFD